MMSYLWILLLGSLLATSAKAQDDLGPVEETAAPEIEAPEEVTAGGHGGPESDDQTDLTAEDVPQTEGEPESAEPAAEAEEPETPAAEDAEPTIPPQDDTEPAIPPQDDTEPTIPPQDDEEQTIPPQDDEEQTIPPQDDAGLTTPAVGDAESVALVDGDGDGEVTTPTAGDMEAEAAATTEEPTTEPQANDPEAEPTESADTTLAPTENGSDEEAGPGADSPVEDNQEETDQKESDPAAAAEPTNIAEESVVPKVATGVGASDKTSKNTHAEHGLNLEDALSDSDLTDNDQQHTGKSRSSNPGANAASATGDDKPQTKEASSSSLAAILSGIGVAAVGAVTGYFTYQKKKLCFKNRQEADPEAARKADAAEAQSDPQVLSNLLNSS
ncbi:CD99 antigen-like protein 2 isoform X2 [Toxotes jaculatrix]|uniref:CD99 antigen-like protein 2 isoform X2 n=1 Tax=Toxotes jaculatrix TaxID=941984 RepID=UPI001B3AC2E6|nr:CD99 antigen-like protein 2 isoform X2 [Toxotes jaculatrix]